MENSWILALVGLLAISSEIQPGEARKESKNDFVRVHVPAYVREGETAILRCLYAVDTDKLYKLSWYKGSDEFFRFTPKEAPPIKTFSAFGGHIDLNLSNSSDVALANVDLNMTDRFTCEATKDYPDYTTSMKAGKMVVVALPERRPVLEPARRSVSVGDTFLVNCTSFRSKPVANITWLLNGFSVSPHYLTPKTVVRDRDSKESITVGLNFTVRQQDFIRNRMTIKCQVKIEPDLYGDSAEVTILERDRPQISSVVDNYSSLPSGGKSDNRFSSSDSLLTTAVPLAQTLLMLAAVHLGANSFLGQCSALYQAFVRR